MQQSHRLPEGGRIDRSRPLRFSCNGQALVGYSGDTLASALIANGVRVVGRSFKFHRPRGVMTAGIEEPNAIFRVDIGALSVPLVRATLQPMVDGLVAVTENAWPSVDFDVGRVLDVLHPLLPAGFYNKTFKWPGWSWYESFIRHAAGSGKLPAGSDPTVYFQHNLHCELLIVGAGPAGLSAAMSAMRTGMRVVIVEAASALGGSLLYEAGDIDGRAGDAWCTEVVAQLRNASNVRVLLDTTVSGCYGHGVVVAADRSDIRSGTVPVERLWQIRAQQIVLATGAIEQPLVFTNNDLPGILLAGAARRYISQYAVTPGHRVLIATNNDDAYRTALVLRKAGIEVAAIVDSRARATGPVPQLALQAGLPVRFSSVIVSARGRRGVTSARVGRLGADGAIAGKDDETIACDAIGMSGGWNPTVHLYSQAGGNLRYDDELACFVPDQRLTRWCVAGAANGSFALADALAEGSHAGLWAARAVTDRNSLPPLAIRSARTQIASWSRLPTGASGRQWVDFRHDVTDRDVELAVRENYTSIEHVKRYTTTGMSIDQGKTSNLNALTLVASLTSQEVGAVGTTTFRPMYAPISMGVIAGGRTGDLYAPVRQLPAHDWHIAYGAAMDLYGSWHRPACYPDETGNLELAVEREVHAVRNAVGVFDGSSLGKIEVVGPDAGEFLNRVYVNNMLSLGVGAVRYGIMLNENGVVLDDGVVARLKPDHYLVTTSSGNADRITAWLEEWHQCEWPNLRVVMIPTSSQWAVITLAGPNARKSLAAITSGIDFSVDSFPHMSVRMGRVAGVPSRVQRVSFSGEISYEVSIPGEAAAQLLGELTAAVATAPVTPFGIEALNVLRLEKGFLHVGTDTDGTTNAHDIGLSDLIERKAGDFVGRRSLSRDEDRRADRRQLIGFEPVNAGHPLTVGAHLVTLNGSRKRSLGFITSAVKSPTVDRWIGIGLLEQGRSRVGDVVTAFDNGDTRPVRVTSMACYDPTGARARG